MLADCIQLNHNYKKIQLRLIYIFKNPFFLFQSVSKTNTQHFSKSPIYFKLTVWLIHTVQEQQKQIHKKKPKKHTTKQNKKKRTTKQKQNNNNNNNNNNRIINDIKKNNKTGKAPKTRTKLNKYKSEIKAHLSQKTQMKRLLNEFKDVTDSNYYW